MKQSFKSQASKAIFLVGLLIASKMVSCDFSRFDLDPPETNYSVKLENISSTDTLYLEWQHRIHKGETRTYSHNLNFDDDSLAFESEILLKRGSYGAANSYDAQLAKELVYLGGFDVNEIYQPQMNRQQLISLLPDVKLFVIRNKQKILVLDNSFFHDEKNWEKWEDPKLENRKIPERTSCEFSMEITDEMLE